MSDNKKYYYIRIKDNFYDTDDIKLLQSMDNGYLYSDILMKLYLKSLKNNGRLMFKDLNQLMQLVDLRFKVKMKKQQKSLLKRLKQLRKQEPLLLFWNVYLQNLQQ